MYLSSVLDSELPGQLDGQYWQMLLTFVYVIFDLY